MHASELVELAAAVSTQGPALIQGNSAPSSAAIEQYWTASKCRLDRWLRTLRRFKTESADVRPDWQYARWPMMRAVFDEILTGEILTRVFAAVMTGYDQRHGSDVAEPAARSVLVGHLEARHRVLTILVGRPGINTEQAMLLNRLRRRCERWSDMLVGYLSEYVELDDFVIDKQRAEDFAEDLRHQSDLTGSNGPWSLVRTSLKSAFGRNLGMPAANPDLNENIACSVLGCFSSDQFDSIGTFNSLWMARLSNAAEDAQNILDEIDAEVHSSANDEERWASQDHLERLRRYGCC
ncbi:MAG: hypothetical protein JXM70_03210 [Pirellulales bacterium]|nr:hypothetical protein [Pirellulales bacterium]